MAKYIDGGIDSDVFQSKNGRLALKKYTLSEKTIRQYHDIQNRIAKTGKIRISKKGKFHDEDFSHIEIRFLELSNKLRTLRYGESVGTLSIQNYITGDDFSQGNQDALSGTSFDEISKIIISKCRKLIPNYKERDFQGSNLKAVEIKDGTLQLIVTDVGGMIESLVGKN